MIWSRRVASAAVATAVAAMVLAAPTTAWARYGATGSASLTVSADVLAPPTSVSFTPHCVGNSGKGSVTVDWTASSDSYANGYTASVSNGGSTASSTTVSGHNSTEAVVTLPRTGLNYTVTVVADYNQWTSTTASPNTTASC